MLRGDDALLRGEVLPREGSLVAVRAEGMSGCDTELLGSDTGSALLGNPAACAVGRLRLPAAAVGVGTKQWA